jgi:hypothetical protein
MNSLKGILSPQSRGAPGESAGRETTQAQDDESQERLVKAQKEWAENGNPSAQYSLGIRYQKGDGVSQDDKLARKWLEKAAAQGNAEAKAVLADLPTFGPDIQPSGLSITNLPSGSLTASNETGSAFLARRAAEGSADAEFALAISYLYGNGGLKKDSSKAKQLLESAASHGHAAAKRRLEELNEAPAQKAQ